MPRQLRLRLTIILALILLLFNQPSLAGEKAKSVSFIKKTVKEFALTPGSFQSENHSFSPNNDHPIHFSLLNRSNGESNNFALDFLEYRELKKPKPRWGRAFLEFSGLMTYSQSRYWIKYSRFIEDWQYRLTWEDQRRRFFTTEALRFDSNAFYLNWTHSLAGALYYEFARANNLSWLQSTMFSVGASLYWEYFVEWREVISISDNIMTGIGGYILGESWFQAGRYFFNSTRSFSRFLSWLNPFLKFNNWLDRKKPLPPLYYHYNPSSQDVYLLVGYRNSPISAGPENTGNIILSIHSRIFTDNSLGLPGKVDEKFNQPIYTQLDFDFMFHGKTREELAATARVVPLGHFRQNISSDRRGYWFYYGLGSSFFLYVKRPVTDYDAGKIPVNQPEDFHFEVPRDFRDKIAAVHLLGPVLDLAYLSGPWKLRLKAEAYPSFALVNSLAINKYSIDHEVQGMKTTLAFYGYHYAFGPALEYQAEINYGRINLKGFASYLYYRSIQGLDRFQSSLLDDSVIRDSRWHTGLSLNLRIPGTYLGLFGAVEWVRRWGQVHQVEERTLERRYYLGVKYYL